MIHARQDYMRFQEPGPLKSTIGFLLSVAASGETLSETEENRIRKMLSDLPLIPEGSSPIPDDEPVLLIRGQDKYAGEMAEHYAKLVREDRVALEEEVAFLKDTEADEAAKENMIEADELFRVEKSVVHHARLIRQWPKKKSPDLPPKKD